MPEVTELRTKVLKSEQIVAPEKVIFPEIFALKSYTKN